MLCSNGQSAPKVTASLIKHPLTGVDEHTSVILDFGKLRAQGIATCSLSANTSRDHCVSIQGDKGEVTLAWAPFRPTQYTVRLRDAEGKIGEPKVFDVPIPGAGMFWEADACARALRDGKTESERCTLGGSRRGSSVTKKLNTCPRSRVAAHDANHGRDPQAG